MDALTDSLAPLKAYKQFILYKLEPSKNNIGKIDKFPINYKTILKTNPHNPGAWTSYDNAKQIVSLIGENYGVGFVLTANDPFFFLDIDNCLVDGAWSDVAKNLMSCLPNAAIEVSQSGKGLHIFGCYSGAEPEHGCKNTALGLELYTSERFVALTDDRTTGDISTDCTALLQPIIDYYFPPAVTVLSEDWRTEPVAEWNGIGGDNDLITKACKSKSVASTFGNKAIFNDLWNNNEAALALAYPTLNDKDPYDRSSADAALAQHLAFWTGNNHERIYRLIWLSGLVRDKWTWHKSYLVTTISNAVNKQDDVYGKRQKQTQESLGDIKISSWGELSRIHFDEMKWIINDFLPPGVSLFVGRPKQGKSWLVHALGLLIAAGRPVFGKASIKSDVLYMALEDSERRLQSRTRKLMKTHGLTDVDIQGFKYAIQAPKLGDNLEESLSSVLNDNNNLKLVIIDVLAKIRTGRKGNQSVYEYDYEVGSRLKEVSKSYSDVAFVVVHHQNKGMGDALDSISGTHGLAGGFDNTYALINEGGGIELHINGRDIEDSDPIPLLKGDDGMWTLESRESAADIRNSDTRNNILSALKNGDSSPKEIAITTGIDTNTLNSSLKRMCNQGLIIKVGWGKYSLASFPTSSNSSHIPPYK